MSWTYDPTQLSTSPLMQVRFMLGDVKESSPLLQDEEINFLLANQSVVNATLQCCDRIIARLAPEIDKAIGPTRVNLSQRYDHFVALKKTLRKSTGAIGVPVLATNQPLPLTPVFELNGMDNPLGGDPDG